MPVLFSSDSKIDADLALLETESLDAGEGSVANGSREGLLLRYIADNLSAGTTAEIETTTLDAGDGTIADHDRAGLLLRYLADNIATATNLTALNTDVGDFSAQVNLQSLLAALGIPDVAGKSLYTCLITDRLDNATYGLNALHTDIDDVHTDVGALNTDVGDWSARVNLSSLLTSLGIPDVAGKSLYTCLITDRLDSATYGLDALHTDIASTNTESETTTLAAGAGSAASNARAGLVLRYICDSVGTALGAAVSTTITQTAATRAGATQIKTYAITCAANAAATTMFTVDDQSVLIKSIVVISNGATTADLTSFNVKGGAGSVVTFIDDATGIRANVAAADQQVSWTGAVVLNDTDTITIDPTGGGATALDMTAIVEYVALVDGGHID